MKQYSGKFMGLGYVVTPTHNRTENNEVKCSVRWEDGCEDFIWFDETAKELISQLNNKIRVKKEAAL
jgi:hypothetical protein